MSSNVQVDRGLLGAALLIILIVCAPLFLAPEKTGLVITDFYAWISVNLGIYYQLLGLGVILFLLWLSLGEFGCIKLGDQDESPEYSNFSWAGMLFCTGTGASITLWSSIEWVFYSNKPPFGLEPHSTEAIEIASAYSLFHWGGIGWCFYALSAVAIAYPFYIKGVSYLRPSTALANILGKNAVNSILGRAVDLFSIVAMVGAAATSLGVVGPLIAACIAFIFKVETSFLLQLGVILFCAMIFSFSVYKGLSKGIKRLSDLNMYLFFGLLIFVVIAGPTLFILKNSLNAVGLMIDNFVRMSTWTDPVEQAGFVEDWTVFYLAWWITFAPPVGVFVARISRGRSIKQVIYSTVLFGTLGSWLFFFVLGNYSLWLELNNVFSVVQSVTDPGKYETIPRILSTLPLGSFILVVFTIICIIATATTYDSASYTLASTATKGLKVGDSPHRMHSLLWAGILGTTPILLMYIGGLDIIRAGVLVTSLPVFFVLLAMIFALTKFKSLS